MSYFWEVIENEAGDKFACQRTPPTGDVEFETSEWFSTLDAAELACDWLNAEVPSELDSLPDHLRPL